MKCFLIRDLLPFYAEGKVSKETRQLIEEHFIECEKCRQLYEDITEPDLDLNKTIRLEEDMDVKQDKEFWRKYYASIYIKGIGIFFAVFIFITLIGIIIKNSLT